MYLGEPVAVEDGSVEALLLVDVGEDGVSDELHVSAGQLVHEHLERGEQQVKIKTS